MKHLELPITGTLFIDPSELTPSELHTLKTEEVSLKKNRELFDKLCEVGNVDVETINL